MVRLSPLCLAFALGVVALSPTSAKAQAPQATQPGVMVVTLNKCSYATLPELQQYFTTTTRPILDRLVREGKLLGWAEFSHGWGDEWNFGWYYLARDYAQFFAAFDEFFAALMQQDPQFMTRFGQWCTEHKDNMYNLRHTATAPTR